MLLAFVIVDVPARALDRAFSYRVPCELASVRVGCAVSVDFGNRPVVGFVAGLEETSEAAYELRYGSIAKLKPLLGVLSQPYFDEAAAQLATWIAHEYLCPLPDAFRLFTPPGGSPKMKRIDGAWQLVFPGTGPVDDRWVFPTAATAEFTPRKNAVKQQQVLAALTEGGMRVAELALELGNVNAAIKALVAQGVVRVEHRRRLRDPLARVQAVPGAKHAPTAEQAQALATIEAAAPGSVVLIDGVTGSGKTEVYLQAIERTLAAGRQAVVLVPEIALTPQTVGRFRARFPQGVAVLHSRLSAGERFDQWSLVAEGQAKVVVGTRSALFAPLSNVGLVVIDEEHDGSYKQDSAPRYRARDVAAKLVTLRGAVLVLGSATPSLEALAACRAGGVGEQPWTRVELTQRTGGATLPQVSIVDMTREFKGGSRSMFSKQLTDALASVYDTHEKAVLMLNKRGFASFVLCRECGFVPECPSCSVSLTFHERGNILMCHHCGHTETLPARCPECGSPYLRKFGAGTERVEAELRNLLPPDMPIVRMDADTVKGKGGHERLLSEFAGLERGVLLGTQMIAKGLDFPEVTLVGVINADTTLKLPDYRAGERSFQLLEQVAGRAGRAEKPGRVIVQTYWPEHPAILAAATHDRQLFLSEELPMRRELGYPPYMRLANVLVWGKDEGRVRSCATQLALAITSAVESAGEPWQLLGPAPCVFAKLKGVYRWHTLIKAQPSAAIAALLEPILKKRKHKHGDDTRVAVDIDPENLL